MKLLEARALGVKAFNDGKERTPSFEFINAARSGKMSALMDAYTRGWDIAKFSEESMIEGVEQLLIRAHRGTLNG